MPDRRVRITKVDTASEEFSARAVPPGRYAVDRLPLSHIAKVSLSGREQRAYEGSARRDLFRMETSEELERIRQERIEQVDGEQREAVEAMRRAAEERRTERERRKLMLPEGSTTRNGLERDGGGDGGDGDGENYKMVVRDYGRVIAGNRASSSDLPEELQDDDEAVEVFNTAVEMKRKGQPCDIWVRGWRMKMIPRHSYGGGGDMYIRSPDMQPESMPSSHHTSATSMRSFKAILEKMKERKATGASNGGYEEAEAGERPVGASCYYAPSSGRVKLDLQVLVRRMASPACSISGPSSTDVAMEDAS
jgi:hypothetical protein